MTSPEAFKVKKTTTTTPHTQMNLPCDEVNDFFTLHNVRDREILNRRLVELFIFIVTAQAGLVFT